MAFMGTAPNKEGQWMVSMVGYFAGGKNSVEAEALSTCR
jgi:hypothetical protein